MQMSDLWMGVIVLALGLYVVLDGYDLGIGTLTLLEPDPGNKRDMYELVARAWDGNETWLVLVAIGAVAGLPVATGVALPALYLPLVLMLIALIWRGISIELIGQSSGWHRGWGFAFGLGSLTAAFCQGAAFGGLLGGVTSRGGVFAGGPMSFLHGGYAVLTGLSAVAVYVLAGASWVYAATSGRLQQVTARRGRLASITVAIATTACWAFLPGAGSLDWGAPGRVPVWLAGLVVLGGGLAHAYRSFGRGRDMAPTLGTLAAYAGGWMILLGLRYPVVVAPDFTVHNASAPNSTLVFLLVGVGLSIPVILAYNVFAYWVFRGKLPARERERAA